MAKSEKPTKLTKIESYILQKAIEKRLEAGLSQEKLSILIGRSITFVNQVEGRKNRAKYNINHVNNLAEALDCSIYDFLPEKPFRNNKTDE